MSELLIKQCHRIAKMLKANFTLRDNTLTYNEVFSEVGMLPAMAKRAEQLSSLCLGYGLGISYEEEKRSMLGKRVIFDDVTPNVLRLVCLTDVLCELVYTAPSREKTPLDELLYD